jgi:hypothetical protein
VALLELLALALAFPGAVAALTELWHGRALVAGRTQRPRTELDFSVRISIRRGHVCSIVDDIEQNSNRGGGI